MFKTPKNFQYTVDQTIGNLEYRIASDDIIEFSIYNNDGVIDYKIILKQIQSALGDEFTTELLLSSLNSRLTLLNKSIYGELEQIR